MSTYAKLRSDLVSVPMQVDGETVFTVKDPITGSYFRLREPEYWLVHCLDGATSPAEVAEKVTQKFDIRISPEAVEQFIQAMDKLLFLENSRSEQATERAGRLTTEGRSLFSRIMFIKVRGFRPGRFLDALARAYHPFHGVFWLIVAWLIALAGITLFLANGREFAVNLRELWSVGSLLTFVIALFIIVTIHEFAHAVACRHYGGEVREIGFLLMYFQPCFYCDLSDAWLFPKKSHRLAVSWAGPFSQLLLLSLSTAIWRITVPGTSVNDLAWMLVTVNWLTWLFNFNPLIRLDGYYMLSDWVDIPNLRSRAFAYLGNLLQRLLGWPVETVTTTPRERRILALYGLLALAYTTVLIGYILLVVGRFMVAQMGGFGAILLMGILVVFLRGALYVFVKGIGKQIRYMGRLLKQPIRLTIYLVLLSVLVMMCVWIPMPRRVSGEVQVRPIAEYGLTLNPLGLLETRTRYGGEKPETKSSFLQMTSGDLASLDLLPLVKEGETVLVGDTIAILSSNQVTREIQAEQAELERLRGQLLLLQAPPKPAEVAEAQAKVDAQSAMVRQIRRDYERIEELVARNLDTLARLETKRGEVEVAEAELRNREQALILLSSPPRPEEEAVIRSQIQKQEASLSFLQDQAEAQHFVTPISGRVLGGTTDGGVVLIAAIDSIELLVPVSDFDITLVEPGQPVQAKLRSFPGRIFEGKVVRVPEAAESEASGMFFPVVVVLTNEDGLLRNGMTGYAKIETGQTTLAGLGARKLESVLRVEFWSWW